uniref:AP complex mu/sigma subunit domain-containing protein n=1 Tax=Catagonus wagneri TaxID=51154 RepID=A0A8C4FEW1_9CETA
MTLYCFQKQFKLNYHNFKSILKPAGLQKWYLATSDKLQEKMLQELTQVILACNLRMWILLECRKLKKYASLYFYCSVEGQNNELDTLELTDQYIELLDKYFQSACKLEIVFNFKKAYFTLDAFVLRGDVHDSSKKSMLKGVEQADCCRRHMSSPGRSEEVGWGGYLTLFSFL